MGLSASREYDYVSDITVQELILAGSHIDLALVPYQLPRLPLHFKTMVEENPIPVHTMNICITSITIKKSKLFLLVDCDIPSRLTFHFGGKIHKTGLFSLNHILADITVDVDVNIQQTIQVKIESLETLLEHNGVHIIIESSAPFLEADKLDVHPRYVYFVDIKPLDKSVLVQEILVLPKSQGKQSVLSVKQIYGRQPTINNSGRSADCIVCLTEKAYLFVLPCRHLCLCDNCADDLLARSKRCPICRCRNLTLKS